MRKFWFADAESVPEFWETLHEPTGSDVNRAVEAPEKGVKGVRAVEFSTFSFPVAEEAEDARSTPGMLATGLIGRLVESGVRLPKRVRRQAPGALTRVRLHHHPHGHHGSHPGSMARSDRLWAVRDRLRC